MRVIKSLMDPDENILWDKTRSPNKKLERVYVITNKRIYYKSLKNRNKNFPIGHKDIIRKSGDIVIIERLGVSVRRSQRRQGGMVSMVPLSVKFYVLNIYNRFGLMSSPYLKFYGLGEEITNEIMTILGNYDSIPDDYKESFEKKMRENNLITDQSRPLNDYQLNSTGFNPPPLSQNSQDQDQQSLAPQIRTTVISRLPATQSAPVPIQSEPQPQNYQQQSPPVHIEASREVYISKEFDKPDTTENVTEILKAIDENLYYGMNCLYCNKNLTSYKEDIHYCENCGAYYHESCLNNMMREGVCLGCNKVVLQ